MAGRSAYTDADRARVYVVLQANGGNVKRTARDTGYPEQTVRRWRNEFQTNPPSTDSAAVVKAADDFVEKIDTVRRLALDEMERKIRGGEAKLGELNAIFGTLTDKAHAIQGLATSRVEHTLSLPSPDELREALLPAMQQAIQMAGDRQEEIVDAEFVEVEQRALPAGNADQAEF